MDTSNALPKSAQPAARTALMPIRDAEDRNHALAAIKVFDRDYAAKWPKAVSKIVDDTEVSLSFFDSPPSTGSISRPPTHRVDLRHR